MLLLQQTEPKSSRKVWKIHNQGDNMQTLLLESTQENINKAGEILRNGGLVGMPTETVYGYQKSVGTVSAGIYTDKSSCGQYGAAPC